MTANKVGRLPALIELPLASRYAIEAMVWLSLAPPDRFHRVRDIADELALPRDFMAKVFRRLLGAGLVAARRGPGGGYRLSGPSREIGLLAVMEAADPAGKSARCCLLFPRLCGTKLCSAHEAVIEAEHKVLAALGALTLADLGNDLSAAEKDGGAKEGEPMSISRALPLAFALLLGLSACKGREMEVYQVAKQGAEPSATVTTVPEAVASPDAHAGHDHAGHDHAGHDHGGAAQPAMPQDDIHKGLKPGAMPAGLPPPPDASPADLKWQAPKGWKSKPAGGMRVATFEVPTAKGGAELSVIVLSGEAGGTLGNVNRWRGQLGLAPMDDAGLKKAGQQVKSMAGSLLMVDLVGSDGKEGMIAAILPKDGQTWFFKLTGPSSATGAAKQSLLQFLSSLK